MIIKKFPISKLFTDVLFPSLQISLLCCISIYILFKDKVTLNVMKKYFVISFVVGVVLQTGSYILILPIFTILIIFLLKNSKDIKSTIEILITIFTIYFINIMYNGILKLDVYKTISFKNYITELIIILFFTLLIYAIKKHIPHKFENFKKVSLQQIRYRMILSISIPISLSIFLIYPLTNLTSYTGIFFIIECYLPLGIPLISIILILIIIYNYDRSLKIEMNLKRETEEKDRIEEYSHVIEEMYNETRKFKHDYINMLLPLKEYIDTSNVNDLKDFFYDNVLNIDKDIKWNNTNIDKLKHIKILPLKALISTKLIKALSSRINIKLEVVEDISQISMNIMDLCRIIGILLDNAIEASIKCDLPKLYFCICVKKDYVVIALHNNFGNTKPVIHKIYEKGFSTKGDGRGLGLYILKDIIDTKYNNVFIDTSVENNMFIQELWIKNIHGAS
ncbi:sensor histidine kinase [Clostridium ljungdahlii]|uniref:Sensory histidine kinase DcuS n=1 Tax=Clostridium ljungdahlii TaxID=1538 RepID=A0A168ML83_9CLOT|nr:GHKL domain-containing protein [Clostridium ljungdahlii]OAA84850.1 sensory histidine kinase DcuS [Clostridium ljungdahlii]